MKLTSEQVKQTVNQLGAQVLPDEHPAMPQLNSMFGEHTFFVDEMGPVSYTHLTLPTNREV